MATGAHELAASKGLGSFRGWKGVRDLEFRGGIFGLSSGIGVSGRISGLCMELPRAGQT